MKQKARKLINVIGVIFLMVLVGLLVYSFLRKGIYRDDLGINLLVVGDTNSSLVVLRPKEGYASWVDLPTDLKIQIVDSDASFPINSVWKFSLGEKNAFRTTERSIGEAMGVAIPRMVKVGNVANIENTLSSLLSFSVHTDLSWRDRWAIRQYLADMVTSKRLLTLDIPLQAYTAETEPDGKVFKEFSSVMNAWTKDKFVFDSILGENCELIVNNLSGVNGAATALARQSETAGVRVIAVKNDETDDPGIGKGCLFAGDLSYPYTVGFLEQYLGCREISNPNSDLVKTKGEIKVWIR